MPASMSTVNGITKEIYQGRIRTQLADEAVGFRRLEKTSEGVTSEVGGKYVTFPIKVRRNHGIGYRNEMEALPAPGQQGFANVRIGLRYGYGRVRMSGQVFALANENHQAFASAMSLEMDGLKSDIAKDTSRIFYGDGTGRIATVSAASVAANTLTVSNPQYLEVGMQIDIAAANSTINASNRQITAVNTVTNVVTFDGAAVATAVGDLLVRTGDINREPNGLASLVTATGALYNVDPAVEPVWAATVDDNGGVTRALSESLLITMTDKISKNGGKTSVILASQGVRRAYFNLLSQQRRFANTKSFAGGFEALEFHNGRSIPFVDDVDAPAGTAYVLDESSFKIYQHKDWTFMDRDGTTWKWVDGFDAYEAVMNKYWEIGINKRNANGVIRNIAEG